jgi:hypothetical protein
VVTCITAAPSSPESQHFCKRTAGKHSLVAFTRCELVLHGVSHVHHEHYHERSRRHFFGAWVLVISVWWLPTR